VNGIPDTERLSFRQIESGDRELVNRLYTDPSVTDGFGREPYSTQELDEKMNQLLIEWVIDGHRESVVCDRVGGQPVGIGGVRPTGETGVGEIGYVFLPEWWGMGYATEAVGAWTRWAFDELNLIRLVAEGVENPASVRALEKAGYKVVSSQSIDRRTLRSLEITKESWQAQGAAL
jgi:RimJ/RimL family protein N-acetyltransferase